MSHARQDVLTVTCLGSRFAAPSVNSLLSNSGVLSESKIPGPYQMSHLSEHQQGMWPMQGTLVALTSRLSGAQSQHLPGSPPECTCHVPITVGSQKGGLVLTQDPQRHPWTPAAGLHHTGCSAPRSDFTLQTILPPVQGTPNARWERSGAAEVHKELTLSCSRLLF